MNKMSVISCFFDMFYAFCGAKYLMGIPVVHPATRDVPADSQQVGHGFARTTSKKILHLIMMDMVF